MADLLMAQEEIKAEVYQLSVYDPSSPSPCPLSLSLLFRHLERDTDGVENDLQEVTPTFHLPHTFLLPLFDAA